MNRLYYYIILLLLLVLASCKSIQYVPVESTRDVYHNTIDTIRDSIYHDVFINQYIKGDTIYKERIEYLFKDKLHNRIDTLIQTDSIKVPYPVERKLTKWQQLKQDYFTAIISVLLALLALTIIIIIFIRKRALKWKIGDIQH